MGRGQPPTNFEGTIGAYKKALASIGDSRPDWAIFGLLQKALSGAKTGGVAA